MDEQERRAEATKAVDARIGFFIHLAVYVFVNAGLVAINLLTNPEKLWFPWPLIGWGVGILFHGVAVFACPKCRGIRERMIAKAVEKQAVQR